MRGGVSKERMERIHAGLPRSLELCDLSPHLEDPLAALGSESTKIRARVRLSQGWHMLNEARSALIEAEACKVFYGELEPNPVEAVYRCRFYLDDAALRLCSSCEHLLQAVISYWCLKVPEGDGSLLEKVITAADNKPQLSGEVVTSLRGLAEDWALCKKYRNDWVHNERPGIEELGWEVSFKSWAKDEPPDIARDLKDSGYSVTGPGTSVRIGAGLKIDDFLRIVTTAYGQLFGAYECLVPLIV